MSGASVVVDGETVGEIRGRGLCVLVGVTHDDTKEKAARLARKLWTVRLFDGGEGDDGGEGGAGGGDGAGAGPGSEKSCSDLGAPLMVISQFTLYGDARKGRRPTWNAAAPGDLAEPLVDEVVSQLRSLGAQVETGRFGADMKVTLTNDGPFTVLLEV